MRATREDRLVKEITPWLKKLAKGWFPPDKKTPDGKHYYACSYCDLNCSRHDKHDDNCLHQVAKNTLEKWAEIEADKSFDKSPIKNSKRTKKDAQSLRRFHKAMAVLNLFAAPLSYRLIPFDYNEPGNENVVCDCNMFKNIRSRKHQKDCVHQNISQIFSDLFNPKIKTKK